MSPGGGDRSALAATLLFAASLVLGVAAASPGQFELRDVAVVLGAMLAVAAMILVATLVVVRMLARRVRGRDASVSALVAPLATLAIGWLCFYVPLQDALVHVSWRLSRNGVLVPVGAIVTAAAVVWLVRASAEQLGAVNRFLRAAGLFVVALPAAQLFLGRVRGASGAHSPFAAALARPVPVHAAAPRGPKRASCWAKPSRRRLTTRACCCGWRSSRNARARSRRRRRCGGRS